MDLTKIDLHKKSNKKDICSVNNQFYKIKVLNFLVSLAIVISLCYSFTYWFYLDYPLAAITVLCFTTLWFGYFVMTQADNVTAAKMYISILFMSEIFISSPILLSPQTGIHMYLLLVVPSAYLLFDNEEKSLRMPIGLIAFCLFFIADYTGNHWTFREFPPEIHQALFSSVKYTLFVTLFFIIHTFVHELDIVELEMERKAKTDPLTGLLNRRQIPAMLNDLKNGLKLEKTRIFYMVLDLDNFKEINDQCGHAFGDSMLINISRYIADILRPMDSLFRIGGDEFLIVHKGSSTEKVMKISKRIQRTVRKIDFSEYGSEIVLSASIGIASSLAKSLDHMRLFKQADIALYAAKYQGKNQVVFYKDSLEDFMVNFNKTTMEHKRNVA